MVHRYNGTPVQQYTGTKVHWYKSTMNSVSLLYCGCNIVHLANIVCLNYVKIIEIQFMTDTALYM
jgi:hypothetical protein